MKTNIRRLSLLLALCLSLLSLFACAAQPVPIEGEGAIRAAIADSLPRTDNFAILCSPVWGEDTTGNTYLVRVDGGSCRVSATRLDGSESVMTLVGSTLYLYEKLPPLTEGGEPIERRLSLSLSDEEAAALAADYTDCPLLGASLADLVLSGVARAYQMPDGKYQFISENPDAIALSEHTGALFSSNTPRELFAVTNVDGSLVYLRVTGDATRNGPEALALYLEYAVSYERETVTAPEDAADYTPATPEEVLPFLPFFDD